MHRISSEVRHEVSIERYYTIHELGELLSMSRLGCLGRPRKGGVLFGPVRLTCSLAQQRQVAGRFQVARLVGGRYLVVDRLI